jgi:hypothetical protein
MRFQKVVLVGLLLSCFFSPGCKDSGPLEIELSDPQAHLSIIKGLNQDTWHVRWQVKYRIVKGKPKPEHYYACTGNSDVAVVIVEILGKDLKSEGIFESEGLQPGKSPTVFKFVVSQAPQEKQKGHYTDKVSNEINCNVKK